MPENDSRDVPGTENPVKLVNKMNLGWQILIMLCLSAALRVIQNPGLLGYESIAGKIGAVVFTAIGGSAIAFAAGMIAHLLKILTKESAGYTYLWVSSFVLVLPWLLDYFAPKN